MTGVTPLTGWCSHPRALACTQPHSVPVHNCPLGFCKSGPAEAHMLHFSRDLQMPKKDGHVPQQRRTKTKRPHRGRHRSDMRASQSGRLSRLTSRLPAADDGEKPAETPCFSCDRSSAAGAPSYSTSARCALLGQRRNTRNKQPNLEGYDGVAEARAAGRPASMGSLLGSQPLRGRAATRPLPEWLPRHVAHERCSQMTRRHLTGTKYKPNQSCRGLVAAMECEYGQRACVLVQKYKTSGTASSTYTQM